MTEDLLTRLERLKPRTTLLLGASDTGKTTLLESLLRSWDPGEPVGVVDCDVGQSHVGPPTTVAWGLIERPFTGWRQVATRQMRFTGAVSPEDNLETFLDAVAQMAEDARRQAAYLFIDTTGLVQGELGLALKRRKIERIQPDLILAIQQAQELGLLLATLPTGIHVERLTASPACAHRTLSARAAYRNQQFARYFANSSKHGFPLDRVRWVGLGADWPTGQVERTPIALVDRLVGLRNDDGEDLALGLVRDVDPDQRRVDVLAPLRDVSTVTTIAVGSLRWPAQSDG